MKAKNMKYNKSKISTPIQNQIAIRVSKGYALKEDKITAFHAALRAVEIYIDYLENQSTKEG